MKRIPMPGETYRTVAARLIFRAGSLHTFDSMRVRDFRIFWISMVTQWSANQMQAVARGWLLYDLTSSPLLLGLLGASMGIPMFMFAIYGGALADRVDKKQLLLWGTLGQGFTMAVIALLITLGLIEPWHILVSAAVQGSLFALTIPGRQSSVPQMVSKSHMINAISLNTAGMNVTTLIAPAFAGFLVGIINVAGVFWIMTSLFVVSALIMLKLPSLPPMESNHTKKMFSDITAGLKYVARDMTLTLLLVLSFVSVAFAMPLNTLLPVFSEDILKVGPEGLGLLLSMGGIGALIGSVSLASTQDLKRKGIILLLMTFLWGASVVIFTTTNIYALALFIMIPVGIGQSGRNVLVNSMVLTRASEDMRGRVIALNMMVWGMQPLGVLPIGASAEVIGAPLAVAIGGAIVAGMSLLLLVCSHHLRDAE